MQNRRASVSADDDGGDRSEKRARERGAKRVKILLVALNRLSAYSTPATPHAGVYLRARLYVSEFRAIANSRTFHVAEPQQRVSILSFNLTCS